MEDKQKVYIKGDSKRGDEIIKLLEDLGGYNSNALYGHDINAYYFINPKGIIYKVYPFDDDKIFPYVREFYKKLVYQNENLIIEKVISLSILMEL